MDFAFLVLQDCSKELYDSHVFDLAPEGAFSGLVLPRMFFHPVEYFRSVCLLFSFCLNKKKQPRVLGARPDDCFPPLTISLKI
jgi:hypothetical protein